jgi:hypothetical protein
MITRMQLVIALIKQRCDPAQMLVNLGLRKAILGCNSALDVGCGVSPTLRTLGVPRLVGLENYGPSVAEARRKCTHDEVIQGDVRKLSEFFKPGQFEAVVAMDVIEHLVKEDGFKLISAMEQLATKRVVFFTPSGFLKQGHTDADDYQVHLSGWEPDEMRRLGYHVAGFLGPKALRGEYHKLKGRPAAIWAVISLFGHFGWTRWCTQKAAAILCVKVRNSI